MFEIIKKRFGNTIHIIQNNLFILFILFSYTVYGLSLLGISSNSKEYLLKIDYYVKIYVSLFLLFRFNPFRKNCIH